MARDLNLVGGLVKKRYQATAPPTPTTAAALMGRDKNFVSTIGQVQQVHVQHNQC